MDSERTPTTPSERIHGLDALRGVLMMLGVFLHCALAYLPNSDWPFVDWTTTSPNLQMITDGVHMFRMPAFFLLSGFFGALLWQRRGARAMLKNRVKRIVLPFAAFVVLLQPVVAFCFGFGSGVKEHSEHPIGEAWDDMFGGFLSSEGTMHLWFLYDLIFVTAFAVIVAATLDRLGWSWPRLLKAIRRVAESPWLFVLTLGGLNFLWCAIFDWHGIPTDGEWIPEDLNLITYYLLWYGVGWVVFSSDVRLSRYQEKAWTLVSMGVMATVLRYGFRANHEEASAAPWAKQLFDGLWELLGGVPTDESGVLDVAYWGLGSLGLVAFTRGFMGLFLRYCGSGSPIWRYLSDSSYWVYLIHLPLTVAVPSLLLGWEAPVLIKYPASVCIVLVISWLSYDALIRPTMVGKFLNGRRYPAHHRGYSTMGTGLMVAWLGFGMVQYPPLSDRPPPWRSGLTPSELLTNESVVYPVQPTVRLESVTHDWCVGVDRYILCIDKVSRDDMASGCAALGASVAQVKTKPEQLRVSQLASALTLSPFWVPITDAQHEGSWRWPDGTVLTRDAPWHDDEPNNWGGQEDCAAMNWRGSAKWNDIPCEDTHFGFICEHPAD